MVKEHTKVGLCIFCSMSVSIGLKIASKVLNIKHFSGQLIINRRVIKSAPPLLSNPTKHILEYEENFLNSDARLKMNQFLDSCTDFVKNGTM